MENEITHAEVEKSALSDFIEVDFTIKIFGRTIISWHFPPKKV